MEIAAKVALLFGKKYMIAAFLLQMLSFLGEVLSVDGCIILAVGLVSSNDFA